MTLILEIFSTGKHNILRTYTDILSDVVVVGDAVVVVVVVAAAAAADVGHKGLGPTVGAPKNLVHRDPFSPGWPDGSGESVLIRVRFSHLKQQILPLSQRFTQIKLGFGLKFTFARIRTVKKERPGKTLKKLLL